MRSVSTLVVALVVGGLTVSAASATRDRGSSHAVTSNPAWSMDPAWSPDGRKIALASMSGVYVMNADGSGKRRLTRYAKAVAGPVWSPDGRRIVFTTLRHAGPRACSDFAPSAGCNWELYVMNADGSGQRRLTRDPGLDRAATWSPNGRELLFHRARGSARPGSADLWVMNADGSGQRRLAATGNMTGAWSPDGQMIAFTGGGGSTGRTSGPARGENRDIYVIKADGSGRRKLTRSPGLDVSPTWSPDGRKIAFISRRGRDGKAEVYVMNADGSGQRNLTRNPTHAYYSPVAWSPDGRKMAFVSDREGNAEVYVMNVDGSAQRRLTRNPAGDGSPVWSSDGRRIAFVRFDDNGATRSDVYVVNADGSGQVKLTPEKPTSG